MPTRPLKRIISSLTLVSILGCYKEDVRPIPAPAPVSLYDRLEAYVENRFVVVFDHSDSHYLRLGKMTSIDIYGGGSESMRYADGEQGDCNIFPRCISYDLPPDGSGDSSKLRADCTTTVGCDLDLMKKDYTTLTGKTAPF